MNILEILSKKEFVSGTDIGRKLAISRSAVHKKILTLKSKGYDIVSYRGLGYKLADADYLIFSNIVESALDNSKIKFKVNFYEKLSSTQTFIKQNATHYPHGTIIIAKTQTDGYGRMSRGWSSNTGGLWFSLLLKPKLAPMLIPQVSLVTSMALHNTLKNMNIISHIKWPNDIIVNSKKIAGIILEMSAEQDILNWLAIGIGINTNNEVEESLNAISLKEVLNENINNNDFLVSFLKEFDLVFDKFINNGFKILQSTYNKNLSVLDKNISIDTGYDIISGKVKGVDKEGKLVLKSKDDIIKVTSGTIVKN